MNRTALGQDWPLAELFGDKVTPLRRVIDEFTTPLMDEAIANWRNIQSSKEDADVDEKEEDANLLAHLVRHTQDPKVLKDELVNLLVAGRDTVSAL